MPKLIKKENLPLVAYAPVLLNGNIVMYNPAVGDGFAAYYPDIDQVRYITYKEIVEYLAGCECTPDEEQEKTKRPRPVHPSVTADRNPG
ncbi:MAG: hypothetical protein WC455_23970 [Dehalococcoidia bacterium]|jgi:hypothetical protein